MDENPERRSAARPPFGSWLRRQRRSRDLTQGELARKVGCAEITVRKIEAGNLRPSRSMIDVLLRQLEVPPAEWSDLIRSARDESRDGPSATHATESLPAPLTPMIGRDEDARRVIARFQTDGARLVTLVGPPGVGKTRLAIEVASRIAEALVFRHGSIDG